MAASLFPRERRKQRDVILVMALVFSGLQMVTGYNYGVGFVKPLCDDAHTCYQTREIAPNIWGFIVTLLCLTTDAWGFASSSQFAWRLVLVFVAGPIMPVWSLIEVLGKAFVGMALTQKLGKSTMTVAKSNSANIIAQCDVLLGMSEDAATRFPVMHTEQNYRSQPPINPTPTL